MALGCALVYGITRLSLGALPLSRTRANNQPINGGAMFAASICSFRNETLEQGRRSLCAGEAAATGGEVGESMRTDPRRLDPFTVMLVSYYA
jgi:hypothetical protein